MSDRRLQVFHTVAGVLNFTRAAELLHMTQPAVTHQIRQLEEEFNARLFDRSNNRISLTAAGEQVMEYADRILGLYDEMQESVKTLTGDRTGLVTLGASTTIAEYMLPGLLGGFRQGFPEVQIRLRVANTDTIVGMVADNSIELGVVESEVDNQLLRVEQCQQDELFVIVPPGHALSGSSVLAARDLLGNPFIHREDGSGTRSVIERYFIAQGITEGDLNCPFELGSTEAIKGAVQAGVGISIVSGSTLKKELDLGKLVALPLNPPLLRSFYLVRQKQKFRTQLMYELFQFARRYFEETLPSDRDALKKS
ncbi:LysR family transcriptional regulator [Granulosicoccus sp. 3-233]|uniref:LysR family transcriptional regulator n=1 Tax=Granulosicoccus sp. 3-233 TaxID=3417969 RepID=UPI003D356669